LKITLGLSGILSITTIRQKHYIFRTTAKIPASYKRCHTFSDFWDAYAKVFPKATHRSVGKGAGETCHMGRWNCTLHQRLARFVRKTLSFSKSDEMHKVVLKAFIVDYNLACISDT
jgi:IS1 family transposase